MSRDSLSEGNLAERRSAAAQPGAVTASEMGRPTESILRVGRGLHGWRPRQESNPQPTG